MITKALAALALAGSQRAASVGDTAGVSQAISATGADVVAVGSTSQTTQAEAVRVQVKVDL